MEIDIRSEFYGRIGKGFVIARSHEAALAAKGRAE